MNDLVRELRRWSHDPKAKAASDLMDEAANEIERLGRLAAPLTDGEREAVGYFSEFCDQNVVPDDWTRHAAALRALSRRTK